MIVRVSFGDFAPAIQMNFQLPRGKVPKEYAATVLSTIISEDLQPEMRFVVVGDNEPKPLKQQPKPLKKHIGRPNVESQEDIPPYFKRLYPDFVCGNLNLTELSKLAQISRPTTYKYLSLMGYKKPKKKKQDLY